MTSKTTGFFLTALMYCINSYGQGLSQNNVCSLLKNEKDSVAYLIDKTGNVSRGPISFDDYKYVYKERDTYRIPTPFKIIIYPSRIAVSTISDGGVLALRKVKPICPKSNAYEVSYSMRENKAENYSWLPWKINSEVEFPTMEDPESATGWANLKFNFDARIVGVIVDGRTQSSNK